MLKTHNDRCKNECCLHKIYFDLTMDTISNRGVFKLCFSSTDKIIFITMLVMNIKH